MRPARSGLARTACGGWNHYARPWPQEALGLFVRLFLPSSVLQFRPRRCLSSPWTQLPAAGPGRTEHWARAPSGPGHARRREARGRPAFRGGPLAPEGSFFPVPSLLPKRTPPYTDPHTLSHSLSCCLKQVEDLCNDIMPFNKNFMRCI